MTGFPKAMRCRASARPESYVDDLKTVEETITPHAGSRSKLYGLSVGRARRVGWEAAPLYVDRTSVGAVASGGGSAGTTAPTPRCAGLGEQVMAILEGWRLLRKLRCGTNRISGRVKAVLALRHASA